MAIEKEKTLVLCVDRDDDLGRKAHVQGPVIGRENNVKAATKLAISDPGEADANSIFGAVKKFDELKGTIKQLEIATITGFGKTGFKSDKILNEQLDAVLEKFPAKQFVLVTDGAEDDQIIPILQGRGRIISKETIIIKQAQAVESTYYTIKEALKDPFLARIVFGIPGLILLLYVAIGTISLQIIALVFGAYLLLKGFGIEEILIAGFNSIISSISTQRTSFPFYIGTIFILVFGGITAYNTFMGPTSQDIITMGVKAAQSTYLFIALAAISTIIGRAIDAVHFKKAYYLRKYFLSAVSVLLIWFILDSATLVFLGQADLNWFLFSILLSFIMLLIAFRVSTAMDVRNRITKLLIGLPVYNKEGQMIGKVEGINKSKNSIAFSTGKRSQEIKKRDFSLREGRILVSG